MSATYRAAPVPWELIGGEAVILRDATLLRLDASGTLIWQLLADAVTLKDLVAVISRQVRVSAKVVLPDVEKEIREFEIQELLIVTPPR